MTSDHSSERVLVLAPVGGDGQAIATLLREHGLAAEVCQGLNEVCSRAADGAGVILLTEEALELAQTPNFFNQLKAQPPWSEMPLIILTHRGEPRLARLLEMAADAAGAITLLERPISTVTLLRSIEVARRSRRRQYQVSQLIEERERNISELKRTEEALAKEHNILETLLRCAPVGFAFLDKDLRFVTVNQRLAEMNGLPVSAHLGRHVGEIVPTLLPTVKEITARIIATGQAVTEHEFVGETVAEPGVTRYWNENWYPVPDAHGEMMGFGTVVEDVTRRKQHEQQLTEQARLLDLSNDAIIVRDLDGCIIYWNHGAEKLYGWKREEALGNNIHAFLHTQFPKPLQEINPELFQAGEWIGELVHSTRDGRRITVLCRKVLDRNPQGNPAAVLETNTDVTERKQSEQRMREQEERLLRLEKVAAAGQLAAALAHEINNPLASVTNCLYLLEQNRDLPQEAKTLATTAASELERVSRIVRQSLSYYRPGTVPEKLDLSAITEESLQVFSDKFRRSGIGVTKRLTPGAQIMGFAFEIRQVIDNLLLNAMEASGSGGRLVVSVRPSRNWRNPSNRGIRLTIGDAGSGIPKENLSRIFEPFFTTKSEKGTGLGLWVVRGIVAKHGGSIRIRSTQGNSRTGTVVSILWPFQSRSDTGLRAGSQSAA